MLEELLSDYALFAAKLVTILFALLFFFGGLSFFFARGRMYAKTPLMVKSLNEKYEKMEAVLNSAILPKKAFRKRLKQREKDKIKEQKKKGSGEHPKNVYVLAFKGDLRASEVASLRECITAILTMAAPPDEVVVLLESVGGTVHGYGLAASQLLRLRQQGIRLTVAVDKVAASGGYMMASVADHIIAAPFAIVGSIGVIGQLPNFHRLLQNLNIDFEQITAGEYKRTLTLFGENTEKGREKYREEIEDVHSLFKEFVASYRNQIDIDQVSTGEHWYGKRALELSLVDQLCTSDDYLFTASKTASIWEISFIYRKPWFERLMPSWGGHDQTGHSP